MAIEFNCKECGSVLRVPDEHAGKKARCPSCSSVLDIPSGGSGEAVSPADQVTTAGGSSTATPGTHPVSLDAPGANPDAFKGFSQDQGSERWSMKTPDGKTYGPVDFSELKQWLNEGRVSVQCQLQREGEMTWQNAGIVFPELNTQPAAPANVYAQTKPQSMHSGGRQYRAHNGVLILIFGIIGFSFCVIFAVIAWIMGSNELAAIKRGEVDPEGKGLATVGMILGMIATILNIAGLGFGCLFMGLGIAAGP